MMMMMMNNPAKFHPNPIWNDGALGFLKSVAQQEQQQQQQQQHEQWYRISSYPKGDQFLIQKVIKSHVRNITRVSAFAYVW